MKPLSEKEMLDQGRTRNSRGVWQPPADQNELARFDGTQVIVNNDHRLSPHVQVQTAEALIRVSVPEAEPLESQNVDPALQGPLAEWFNTSVPNSGNPPRTVGDLVYDQWLRLRNGKPAERVPTPDQIADMKLDAAGGKTFRVAADSNRYAIEKVVAMPNCHLLVGFRNGDVRVVDIKAMRGDSAAFREAFDNFDAVEFTPFYVEWKVGANTVRSKIRTSGQRGTRYRNFRAKAGADLIPGVADLRLTGLK